MTIPDTFGTGNPNAFREAVAAVERNRRNVRGAVGVALVARLQFEFNLIGLVRQPDNLLAQVPNIGIALLAYLVVMMWMAKNAGDRLGFGMALGLGVVEAAFLIVTASMQRPFVMSAEWKPLVVAAAHLPMAIFAIIAAQVYPPQDSKAPWVYGFVVALAFLSISWLAPSLVDAIGS